MNDTEDAVMTVQEVSQYLRLAESTVYKLAQEGKLPGRKIGGEIIPGGIVALDAELAIKNGDAHWHVFKEHFQQVELAAQARIRSKGNGRLPLCLGCWKQLE
jgi:excisionase family DNA binding protein